MESDRLLQLGETIEKITTSDVGSRGVVDRLYAAARRRAGGPMAVQAARLLAERVKSGDFVIIATGWPNRPYISPLIAETDGPPGAATLARALCVGLRAAPLILVEEQLVGAMKAVATAAGLCVMGREEVENSCRRSPFPVACAVVEPFPVEPADAEKAAAALVAETQAAAFVAVERGGCSEKGQIHMSSGRSTTALTAKTDFVLDRVRAAGGVTVGVGDGGNELGMGNIREEIVEAIPRYRRCICGCESGIVPVRTVDVLVLATVSNWGAYAIEGALAGVVGKLGVMHTDAVERSVLRASAQAGLIDGLTGICDPSVDGLPEEIHCAIVCLLRAAIAARLEKEDT